MLQAALAAAGQVNVPPHLVVYWDGFNLLNRSRQGGFASGQRITLCEIEAAARILDITGLRRFALFIQEMDTEFFQITASK